MRQITAVETSYNGYSFRSRLEARWAVFFDAMKIKYEYEVEGITTTYGINYLPDFFLPEFHCFFEVKYKGIQEENPQNYRDAIRKISNGQQSNSWAGIICFGDPVDDDMTIFCQEANDSSGGSYTNKVSFGIHPQTRKPCLFAHNDSKDRWFFDSWGNNMFSIPMYNIRSGFRFETYINDHVNWAKTLSRSARFENGHSELIHGYIEEGLRQFGSDFDDNDYIILDGNFEEEIPF